jgi:hypothetical protein
MFLQIPANAELAHGFIDLTTGSIAVVVALSGVVVYLYKRLESKNDLFIKELRDSNEKLSGLVTGYNKFLDKMDKIFEAMEDKK